MPYGYAASIAYALSQGMNKAKYPNEKAPETRWVIHWEDHHETYETFEEAKTDFLNFLWFWADDFIYAEPDLYRDIMAAWEIARRWPCLNRVEASDAHHHVIIQDKYYGMTRLDAWEGRISND